MMTRFQTLEAGGAKISIAFERQEVGIGSTNHKELHAINATDRIRTLGMREKDRRPLSDGCVLT